METWFHHHPDGLIVVRGDAGVYGADLATFAADCTALGLPAYEGVPVGMRERRYTPGQRHTLHDATSQYGAAIPWPAGDAYCTALPDLLAAQAARESA
ncbi:MAG TPA: hypothetical protein VF406_11775 [Thermodesulfobacteriota bacterium]